MANRNLTKFRLTEGNQSGVKIYLKYSTVILHILVTTYIYGSLLSALINTKLSKLQLWTKSSPALVFVWPETKTDFYIFKCLERKKAEWNILKCEISTKYKF